MSVPKFDGIAVEWPHDEIAIVRIDRPEKLNALTYDMVVGVRETMLALGAEDQCRVVVLTGAGRAFCAGLDLDGNKEREAQGRTTADRMDGQERFTSMIKSIRNINKPVIAAVNGAAAGSGFALTLASDVRVAAESVKFHVASIKIGISGGECGMSYLLPKHIGSGRAFEILLTGRPIDAHEADRLGLLARVVADGTVVDAALEIAHAIRGNSPFAVRMTKKIMWSNLDNDFEAAIELENRTQILAIQTADSKEAISAFLEKRAPNFTGG